MFKKLNRITSLILIFCFCLSAAACGNSNSSSSDTTSSESFSDHGSGIMSEVVSEEPSKAISEESSEVVSEESSEAVSEESSEVVSEESSEVVSEESSEAVSEESSEVVSEESSEVVSEESSEVVSEESSEETSVDWTNQGVTYFKDTGKCTYTTVYSPKTNDKVTYTNNGIYLYNTDFRMSSELEAEFLSLFNSFKNPQSITVREMNTEFVFAYNPNKRIACASAIKAPFSLFITKCIEQGLVSWTEKLPYEEKYDYFAGSGVIQENYEYGTIFSVKRLYELMLYVSDNIAYLMLKDRFGGASRFNDAVNAIGCNDIIDWGNWGNLTSYEMALVWREIYYYTRSGSSASKKLYTELDRALYNELAKGIKNKDNLHKSGWSSNGYNDAGIFFDGNLVYSVAVMTGRKELTDNRNATHLIKVAKLIDKLMAEYKAYSESLAEDVETPSADVETPSSDVETPSADVETPSADIETPSEDVETPSTDVETPSTDVETPSADVETPSEDAETPSEDAETPSEDIETSSADVETPSEDVETSSADVETPSADVETPSADVETPSEDVETPSADVETPSADVETPSEDAETPSEDAETSSQE